jgi:hypothetical protein
MLDEFKCATCRQELRLCHACRMMAYLSCQDLVETLRDLGSRLLRQQILTSLLELLVPAIEDERYVWFVGQIRAAGDDVERLHNIRQTLRQRYPSRVGGFLTRPLKIGREACQALKLTCHPWYSPAWRAADKVFKALRSYYWTTATGANRLRSNRYSSWWDQQALGRYYLALLDVVGPRPITGAGTTLVRPSLCNAVAGNDCTCASLRAWNDRCVVRLARELYQDGDFTAMPILADALEDAGQVNPEITSHLRGHGLHTRSCWVLEVILNHAFC